MVEAVNPSVALKDEENSQFLLARFLLSDPLE